MKFVPVGTSAILAEKKQKEQEARVLGFAAIINLVVVVLQILVLGFLVSSLALQAEMMHTASDLIVNTGAWWIAYKALTMSKEEATQVEKKFMYWGIVILLLGAAWTANEAIEKIASDSAPLLQGVWLVTIGLIGGAGNFIAHLVLKTVPHAERSHKHKLVHLHVIEDMILASIVVTSGLLGGNADAYLSLLAVLWVCKRAFNIYQDLKSGKKLGCC